MLLANVLQLFLQEDYKNWWERKIKHFGTFHMFVILLVVHSPTASITDAVGECITTTLTGRLQGLGSNEKSDFSALVTFL